MTSAVERMQMHLQDAMDRGNQASLGQAIYASKGVNGLKQLRRSAKARLKQLSVDQNREMIGSYMPPEEPLTWRTTEQGDRYRAVAHLPTSIIGWVIGHKGCNARMLKQQTGTELWVDVPGQCVIIVAKALEDVEEAMKAVSSFVKTAPTFIAKVQAGGREGVTQTVRCPVHLLPSIQRLSRKIQIESGANYVFANSKMSTFCVTGDKKNVEEAVTILKRLIADGNAEMLAAGSNESTGNGGLENGDASSGGCNGERMDPVNGGSRVWRQIGHTLFRDGNDLSRRDGSPPTAPCSPEDASPANAWGNGAPSQTRTYTWSAHQTQEARTPSSMITSAGQASAGQAAAAARPLPSQHNQLRSHGPVSAPTTLGDPFRGASAGGPSSDLSFFSFEVGDNDADRLAPEDAPAARASTAPTPGVSGVSAAGHGGVRSMLPGLGFLEDSARAVRGQGNVDEFDDDKGPPSNYGPWEFDGGGAHGCPAESSYPGSMSSRGVASGRVGVGAGLGRENGGGYPKENIELFLEELGLSRYLPVFQNAEVDLETLYIMSEQDFCELGLLKGPRVKIMHHLGSH